MLRYAFFLPLLALALLAASPSVRAADPAADPAYRAVDIAPTKTSFFIGSVRISFTRFNRSNGVYEGDYRVNVFPLFYHESGLLRIEFNDDQIRRLHRGETVSFVGTGLTRSGARRGISGKAVPEGLHTGRLTVNVVVTRSIKLVFHTAYHLAGAPQS